MYGRHLICTTQARVCYCLQLHVQIFIACNRHIIRIFPWKSSLCTLALNARCVNMNICVCAYVSILFRGSLSILPVRYENHYARSRWSLIVRIIIFSMTAYLLTSLCMCVPNFCKRNNQIKQKLIDTFCVIQGHHQPCIGVLINEFRHVCYSN